MEQCDCITSSQYHACIIIWSLGNEAGRCQNLWEARKQVHTLDRSRLVCYESGAAIYEGTGRTELTDVICTMYPVLSRTKQLATRRDEDRPVILCEYSHAMGNSNGNLHYYWNAIWDDTRYPRLQGGCIWDFVDQGLRVPDKNNVFGFYFAYGGDFGDTCHDAQFCINGMFSPDREPHPAVAEIKYLMQPVLIQPAASQAVDKDKISLMAHVCPNSTTSVVLSMINRYSYRDLSHLSWSWQLKSNRSANPVRSGRFQLTIQGEKNEATVALDSVVSRVRQLERSKPMGIDNTYHLNIRGFLKKEDSWAPAGHVLVSEQFHVKFEFDEMIPHLTTPLLSEKSQFQLESKVDDNKIQIYRVSKKGTSRFVEINRTSGSLISYSPNGKELLYEGIVPNFSRAATDNDRGGIEFALDMMTPISGMGDLWEMIAGTEDHSYFSHWKKVGLNPDQNPEVICLRTRITDASTAERIGVVALCVVRAAKSEAELFKIKLHFTIYSDGRVRISKHVAPQAALAKTTTLARVGVSMQVDPSLFQIEYYGKGPHENYPDRKTGSEIGVYKATPETMAYNKYVVPGENGSRSDCEWVSFRSTEGDGMCIVSTSTEEELSLFSCSALLHSAAELHNATHTCDLDRRKSGIHPIHVNIDHKLLGVGGDNSWFPVVYPEFLVKPNQEFHYNLWLLPLQKDDEAPLLARNILHG